MKTKINPLGALATLALALFFGVTLFKPAPSTAAPLDPIVASVLANAPPGVASLFQVTDNKAPWADSVPAKQFGLFYDWTNTMEYTASTNWTATIDSGGTAAVNTTTGFKGGGLLFTTDTTDDDQISLQTIGEHFLLEDGDVLVFTCRFTTPADSTQWEFGCGVGEGDTDWLGDTAVLSDGIFFEKNDGDLYLDLVFAEGVTSTADYTRKAAIYTIAASTTYDVCFVVQVDPNDSSVAFVRAYVNGAVVFSGQVATDINDSEAMSVIVAEQNGAAAASICTIGSIGCAQSY